VFQYWRPAWSRSSFLKLNDLKTVKRSDLEGLRDEIASMCDQVEAYLMLHPKPLSWLDRLFGIFRRNIK
jgi:hypothetical protein